MKLLCLVLFAGTFVPVAAQKANLVKQLNSFVPEGFAIKDTAFGDLNNDKKMDVVLVAYAIKEDAADFVDTAMNIGRPLLVLLQEGSGKLQLAKRNDSIVMCRQCGGMMGDPFQSVAIKNNTLILEFYGGSSWRWGDTYGFSWSPGVNTWILTKENHLSYQTGDPEATTKNTNIPPAELDNWTIDNFNINQLGEKQEVPGKVIAAKTYFHNAPNAATRRKAYVTHGDTIRIVRAYRTFYEVFFTKTKEQITSGYVLKKGHSKTLITNV